MLFVDNIKSKIGTPEEEIVAAALKRLHLSPSQVWDVYLYKSSVDARKKGHILLVSTVAVRLKNDESKYMGMPSVRFRQDGAFQVEKGKAPLSAPIYIAGFGPAGMFCAYLLAKEGYRPIVLERGGDVDQRVAAVEGFFSGGGLDPVSNIQFGEGGAGTFSDGKLTTRINDPLCDQVLKLFSDFGAPKETLKRSKPHIGTDHLRKIVKRIRQEIVALGGEVRFFSKLTDFEETGGTLRSVEVNGERFPASALVLAVGHSARDTFQMLYQKGIPMENKPFSVGARIEQKQSVIDKGLYGEEAGNPLLPPGEYQLSYRKGDRGVYTFCMCPGGTVVAAASEEGTVVTNGMSEYRRDKENANAALVVSVDQKDFGNGVLDGVAFQEQMERRAFALGGGRYRACGSGTSAFLGEEGKVTVDPSYPLGVTETDLSCLFPQPVTEMMQTGLRVFEKKLPGFCEGAFLTGPETRTSSPVRILRDESFCSPGMDGLYPCGEGAGYAGGIMSAAVDGLRIALQIIKRWAPLE